MTVPPGETLPPTLVSVDELIRYMSGISLTESQKTAAEEALRGVQNELEINLNRPVQPIHIREVAKADCRGRVYLTVSPIHRVLKVERVNEDTLDNIPVGEIARVPMEDLGDYRTVDRSVGFGTGYAHLYGGITFQPPGATMVVEYIGGYIGYWDQALKQAIKRVAAREIESNHDDSINLRTEAGEPNVATDARVRGWTKEELLGLSRLRRRVIA